MELFAELYDVFGVASLLIIGGIYGGKYLTKTIEQKDERIKELEELNLELVNKSLASIEWFKSRLEALDKN